MENKLTAKDFVKMAQRNENIKLFFSKLAALGASQTEFDEKVPTSENPEDAKAQDNNQQNEAVAEIPQEQAVQAPNQNMQTNPEAMGAAAAQAFIGPEVMQAAMSGDPAAADLVARIAGQIASSMSKSISESAASQPVPTAGAPALPGQNGGTVVTNAQAVPAAPMTPEEALANEIAPQTQPTTQPPTKPIQPMDQSGQVENKTPQPPPEGNKEGPPVDKKEDVNEASQSEEQGQDGAQEQGQGISDEEALKKLISLAKSGKI